MTANLSNHSIIYIAEESVSEPLHGSSKVKQRSKQNLVIPEMELSDEGNTHNFHADCYLIEFNGRTKHEYL